eukprot:CAMPEP_0115041512 /NCGR_PEP_ID=MMETSP0216-20121206/45566_1 /TAXON_ID=223996 /ORGANISM="Protocruzia adherens, Strain Boccale" /LENGTH=475 /DNA_ID=CAMNT_0002423153 /DNA_START=390 /DNA_END=1817 /DNA_ORIENTATION=-
MEPSANKELISPQELEEYADLIESMRKSDEYLEYAIVVETRLLEFMDVPDEKMEFERLNSFNRFLVHRVCDLFRLERYVEKLSNEPRLATILVTKKPDSETPRFRIKAAYDRYIEHEKERNGVVAAHKLPKKLLIKRREVKKKESSGLPELEKSKSETVSTTGGAVAVSIGKKGGNDDNALERSQSFKIQKKGQEKQVAVKPRQEEVEELSKDLTNMTVTNATQEGEHKDGEEEIIDPEEHDRHVERVRDYELSKEKIFNEDLKSVQKTDSQGRKIHVFTGEDKSLSRTHLSDDPDFRRSKGKPQHYHQGNQYMSATADGVGMGMGPGGYYPMYSNNPISGEGLHYGNDFHNFNEGGGAVSGNGDALLDSEGGIPLNQIRGGHFPALSGSANFGPALSSPHDDPGHGHQAASGQAVVSYAQYATTNVGNAESNMGYGGYNQPRDNNSGGGRFYPRNRGAQRGNKTWGQRGSRGGY